MPAVFNKDRYQVNPSEVEKIAQGGPTPVRSMAPAGGGNAIATMAPVAPSPAMNSAPMSLQQINARRSNFITGQGAQAAGEALSDVKAGDEYRNVASQLDALRNTYTGRRQDLFNDANYKALTQRMAQLLRPVDLARGDATQAAKQTFGAADTGYNQAKFAQDAGPLEIDAMRAANDQTRAGTGLIEAKRENIGADTGMTQAQTAEVPANASSARNLQGSQAGLNTAQAENLPKETDAKIQGNKDLAKAQNEAITYRQRIDQQTKELADLRAQLKAMQDYMAKNGDSYVDVTKVSSDNGGQGPTTQPSTGGTFNGSRSPLASNAGGGKVPTTQPTAAPGSFAINPDGTATYQGRRYAPKPGGGWQMVP